MATPARIIESGERSVTHPDLKVLKGGFGESKTYLPPQHNETIVTRTFYDDLRDLGLEKTDLSEMPTKLVGYGRYLHSVVDLKDRVVVTKKPVRML